MSDSTRTYTLTGEQIARLNNNFTYHAPKDGQAERYALLRNGAKQLAQMMLEQTPVSREQSLALTALEDAVM